LRLRRPRRAPHTATPVVELQQVALGPLRAFDLVVYPGERIGVLGAPGSGKTVLAELLVGARQPQYGRIRRDGIDVTGAPSWAGELAAGPSVPGGRGHAAAGVAWLAQHPRPFRRLTVYENVLVAALAGRRRSVRVAETLARTALARVDLELMAERLPVRLTPSQLARMEAARALASPSRLVVVDQLSARVDAETATHIAAALGDCAAEGAAILWLETPDAPPAGVERLVVLAYGRVAQEGPTEQVLATQPFGPAAGTAGTATTANTGASARTTPTAGPGAAASQAGSSTSEAPDADRAVLRVRSWTAPDSGQVVVRGLDLDVSRGEIVVLLGEGDDASTVVLRSLAGFITAQGRLWLGDRELTDASAVQRARAGLALVPRDGAVVDRLTVAEHLSLAGARRRRGRWSTRAIYEMVPSLGMARHRPAGSLPPLERRCLALARALVTDPPVLLVDRLAHGVTDHPSAVLSELLMEASRQAAVVLGDVPSGFGTSVGGRVVRLDGGPLGAPNEPARSRP
jgi:branched-chain amino acid transport system ATP-binding protein